MFGRGSGPRDTSPRDAALPVLTEQQAQRLRSLVRQAFAELGVEATVFADHLRDAQGREFGVANLAAICAAAEQGRDWPGIVEDHVARMLRIMDGPQPLDDMNPEQIRASARVHRSAGGQGAGGTEFGLRAVSEVILVPAASAARALVAPRRRAPLPRGPRRAGKALSC